ncbi:MAG: response regulator [Candidatus Nitronauta litoralis]|uniref:Response regulator n=1 Tax=Candidatus Nitronauta litoralis TaxID=2705533 RepID=A0A7T0BV43_9BACT|nr:MAG: response regulator [Candidatus Nitronauta litoralis]
MIPEALQKDVPIIIAEDDEDDYMLTLEALNEAGINSKVTWVKDGEELMEYLSNCDMEKRSLTGSQKPGLILLDLNMPRKDGREALQEIKSNAGYRKIPVVVLSTSKSETDIDHSYELGVNSFIQKPVRFNEFVEMVSVLSKYWFSTVQLPE